MTADVQTAPPIATLAAAATMECPKCGHGCRSFDRACARCGLLASRFSGFRDATASETLGSEPLDEAWAAARAAWTDVSAHDRLLDLAARAGALPELSRCYSAVLRAGADAVAQRRIKQICVLLEHSVRAQAREARSSPSVRALWALGYAMAASVLVASAWVFFIAWQRHG